VKAKNKRKITELTLQKAKASDGKVLAIWDTLCPGLMLAIQPSGAKAFRFFYSFRGKPRWVHLGHIYISDARRIGFKLRAAIAEGRDPAAERRNKVLQVQQNLTFAELHERYLTEFAKRKNKSWRQADRLIRRYVLPKLGKIEAASITRADIRATVGRIAAPILANQVLKSTGAVFSWATKQDIIGANPVKGIERNPTAARERILSDTEIAAFWKKFERLDLVRSAALRTLLLTGQRPGEVASMRWEHIKDGTCWELPGQRIDALSWPGTKNGRNHRVWLSEPVRDIIATIRAGCSFEQYHGNGDSRHAGGDSDRCAGFVFEQMGHAVTGLAAAMSSICTRLGVERATPHDLRRTHGSTITGLGFGRDAMNRIQNHKEGKIADVYDRHDYKVENKKIMERVAQHIVAIAEGREGGTVIQGRF
jgi:integrase